MKRVTSLLLCIALLLSLCSFVSAAEVPSKDEAIEIVDRTSTILLHHQNTSAYDVYKVQVPTADRPEAALADDMQTNEKDFVLSLCSFVEYEQLEEHEIYSYTSALLGDYINDCAEVTDISRIDDSLYVGYTTTSNKEVTLCYDTQGFDHVVIYDPVQDRATLVQGDNITRYEHFREGCHFEMSEELLDEINICLQEEDYDRLLSDGNLQVTIDEGGAIWIEPSQVALQASSSVSDDARNLQQLEADFPQYTNEAKLTTTMYSNELKKNFTVTVKESRDSYTKKQQIGDRLELERRFP